MIKHELSTTGTPKRRGTSIEKYVFALFNEDLKDTGTESNFGLFYPSKHHVYYVNFSPYTAWESMTPCEPSRCRQALQLSI